MAVFSIVDAAGLIKTGEYATDGSGDEAVGKPGRAGVYTNQRLNLSKPWEGPLKKCQGFKPDPGNLAVRHYRGASRNVRHGETVNPPAIERAGPETPHLQRGALDLYPNRRHHSKPDPRLDPTRPFCAGVLRGPRRGCNCAKPPCTDGAAEAGQSAPGRKLHAHRTDCAG